MGEYERALMKAGVFDPPAVTFVALVQDERERQKKKWGVQDAHSLDRWSNILTEELGEFAQQVNELESGRSKDIAAAILELVQVGAVAQSIYENYFRPLIEVRNKRAKG